MIIIAPVSDYQSSCLVMYDGDAYSAFLSPGITTLGSPIHQTIATLA